MPNGNPERTNISLSDFSNNPPYKLKWSFNTEGSYPIGNIVISDGLLFLSNLKGEVFAVNVNSGSNAGSFTNSSPSSINASLIYKNGLLVTLIGDNEKSLIYYDINSGNEKWNLDLGWVQSSPAMSDESVIIGNMKGVLYNVNIQSGAVTWKFRDSSEYKLNQFSGSASIHNRTVYTGNVNGFLYSVNLYDGKLKWKFKTNNAINGSPSVYDDKIFFTSDDLYYYCIDTSGNLVWKYYLGTKSLSCSAFDSGIAFVSGIDGAVYALNINTGELVWKFQSGGAIWASPLVHKKMVFIGSFDKNIYCLNSENGEILWQFETEGKIRSNTVIWNDLIFVSSDDKNVYCFKQY